MRCLSSFKESWTRIAQRLSDEELEEDLDMTEPNWNCGDDLWRLWKRIIAQEAQRRGLRT